VTEPGIRASLEQELAQAEDELAAARALMSLGHHRVAMTRISYAAFHAARALVYSEGLEPRSHEGVHHFFHMRFVVPGRIDPTWGRALGRLQKYREQADYGQTMILDAAATGEEVAVAEELVRIARAELERAGFR
jgi:uncharacterized protein (UPF0332 family)